jgi:Tol biopolymer transport system component
VAVTRISALATVSALVVLAAAAAAGSSSQGSASRPKGLIAGVVQRCDQLVAIPVDGASVRNVSRNLACNGAPVWSQHGEVAFVKRWGSIARLALMKPDGSGQRYVTSGSWAGHPRWAPTGRRLLYIGETGQVHVLDLDAGTDRELSDGGTSEWSPDGNEIATVGNFQLSIERADGSGRRVVPTSALISRILGWSTSGAIAFAATDGFIWTIRPNGTDERRLTMGFSGTWSPDGTRLAVARGVYWPAPVVVIRPDGSEVAVIAHNADSIPGWSPDSSKLAFRVDGRLRIADAAGRQQTTGPTIGGGDPDELPAWSPNGQTILIRLMRDDFDVFGFDARSGSPRPLLTSTADEFTTAFSPDGERVLFSKRSGGGPLYVARPHGHGQRKLASIDAVGGGAWSPDGSQIAYVSRSRDLHVADMGVNPDAGKVILHGVAYGAVSWSPNGRRLVIADFAAKALYTLGVDGRGKQRVFRAHPKTRVFWPEWSPRGDRIVFAEFERCDEESGDCAGPAWITTVTLAGRAYDRLTQGGPASWSPDGRFIAYADGGINLFDVRRRTSRVLSRAGYATTPDWQATCSLRGSRRSDLLRGTARADLVCGLEGDDLISGGPGRDKLFGEQGDDRILAVDRSFDVVGCGPGRDLVIADRRDLVGRDCERVSRR